MRFVFLITVLCGVLNSVSAVAAEPSLDWPFYRAAMQWEAAAMSREEPVRFPWARELNRRVGFGIPEASDKEMRHLSRIVSLSSARL